MRTAKPCGPGTRCWCQVGGGFRRPDRVRKIFNPPMAVTRRIRRRGERGISRKTIVQGMPGCSDCTCMLVCACYCFLHARPRVQRAPGVPCALFLCGRNDLQGPGETRRGNAEVCFVVIASEAKQSTPPLAERWIASRSLSSGAHSRDPVARNDGAGG
jgi:hypothetical protein